MSKNRYYENRTADQVAENLQAHRRHLKIYVQLGRLGTRETRNVA